MAAVATANKSLPVADTTQSTQIVRGTIALSGVYGGASTNGDTLNLAISSVRSPKVPIRVLIYEQPAAGTAPTGYQFMYGAGTNATNGVLIVLQNGAINSPAAQITAAGAYLTALLTASAAGYIHFEAIFPLGQ
jgi:hypothetical protein